MTGCSTVMVTIDGLRLESLNRPMFGASRGAVFARARRVRELRQSVRSHVLPHVGTGELRAIEITRISPRRLDGIADAWEVNDRTFVIVGDREGVRVTARQDSYGPKRFGLIVRLLLEDRCL